jgi:1-acyl-sn-glycerol-3-phosphate acyltransferase
MLLVWFVKITSAPFLFLYFKLRLKGKKRAGKIKGRVIIIGNHTSTWDPVLMNYVFPLKRIYFMTAQRMFTYKAIFNWFLKTMGAYPTDRQKADLSAIEKSNELLAKEKILGIFPEGKRSLTGEMLPFKPGFVIVALNSGAPIIPLYHMGKYGWFHRQKVVVGERIYLKDYCSEEHPSPETIAKLIDIVNVKMQELKEETEKL